MIFSKFFQYISLKYNLLFLLVFLTAGLSAQVYVRKNSNTCGTSCSRGKTVTIRTARPVKRSRSRKKKWTAADAMKAKKSKHELKSGDLLAYFQQNDSPFLSLNVENLYSGNAFREKNLYIWTSSKKDSVRYYSGRNSRAALTFAGQKFAESIIDFRNGKFSRFYVSVFNEGDDTGVSYTANTFTAMLNNMTEMITLHLRKAPEEGNQKLQRFEKIRYYSWSLPYGELKLNWSSEKNKQGGSSYCYIEFLPSQGNGDAEEELTVQSVDSTRKDSKGSPPVVPIKIKKKQLAENVKRDGEYVVIQGIPMVDQGPKGYCVPAVLERLFSYYGGNVNQHVLAGLMDTTAKGGTNSLNMYTALRKISKKLNVDVRKQYEFMRSAGELEKFVSKYNSLAKKEKAPRIKIARFGEHIDLQRTFLTADPQIGRNALFQLKKRAFEKYFCGFVKEKIDAGIPVLWAVIMDFSPEQGGGRGGHLRLITGYGISSDGQTNSRSRKKSSRQSLSMILFSDTWGRGHEVKKMETADAWAITSGLYYIEPDN